MVTLELKGARKEGTKEGRKALGQINGLTPSVFFF